MNDAERYMNQRLMARDMGSCLRHLTINNGLVDFCSNDYLGFSVNETIADQSREILSTATRQRSGSTGSRLISGNSEIAENAEQLVADFHHTKAALIFNSGYDANAGLFSCVPERGDVVVYDELIHASVRDGIRLGFARSLSFRHNDLEHLTKRLSVLNCNKFVAIESLYSMDGDAPDLTEVVKICQEHNANLIVDEAHATGVFGKQGRGMVTEMGLENEVFARVHTFGKALGCHGAAVVGSPLLKQYLLNFARSFIFTTALPPGSFASIIAAYEHLKADNQPRDLLRQKIEFFRKGLKDSVLPASMSFSPIQSIIIPGNDNIMRIATDLIAEGFDIRAVRSPTVPAGTERLRITLHSYNTEEEISRLCGLLNTLL
ncbi:MAG: 8-amino-7-oxononanoate synthase [Bacteroidetes bacterium]|nr:8-amino-7-oxononanoate synthase [Bacteroidota bacterium]MBU1719022.1 8-amino-7-oxononanoate synthase [Bacteroidota bacterium]